MKRVTMYECEYCHKLFKTSNKHYCRYNPNLRNCFSCKNNQGFEKEEHSDGCHSWFDLYVNCKVECDYEFQEIKSNNYNLQCDKWEPKEG